MKKLTLLIAALLLVGATAFAADLEVATSATLSGEASVTWGYDLDTGDHGFKNEASADVTVTFVPKANHANSSDAETYGWIQIKDVEVKLDDDDGAVIAVGAVEAKIILGPAYIDITNASNEVNYAKATLYTDPAPLNTIAVAPNPTEANNGIAVGVALDGIATLEAGITSANDWTDGNDETAYNFYVKADLTAVEGLELGLKLSNSGVDGEGLGFGAGAGYTLSLGDYGLGVKAGIDLDLENENTEISAGLHFAFPGAKKGDQDWFGLNDIDFEPGITVAFDTLLAADSDNNKSYIVATFSDADLIPVVDLAALYANDLADDANSILGVRASATVGPASPWGAFWTSTILGETFATNVEIGTDLAVIENTTFTAKWVSGNLSADESESGVVSFTAKVSF